MAIIHRGASLTPHFREFLPAWLTAQSWYAGAAGATVTTVGCFRIEDPAGEVGVETHLLGDGAHVHQVPLTYRGVPLDDVEPVAVAEHSVLGTRWIYDGEQDPLWRELTLRLVLTQDVSEPASRDGSAPASAIGLLIGAPDPAELDAAAVELDVARVLAPGRAPEGTGVLGAVMGSWHPDGPARLATRGCLITLRRR